MSEVERLRCEIRDSLPYSTIPTEDDVDMVLEFMARALRNSADQLERDGMKRLRVRSVTTWLRARANALAAPHPSPVVVARGTQEGEL